MKRATMQRAPGAAIALAAGLWLSPPAGAEESWWVDPPTMVMLDEGWEDWPSWGGAAGDIDPSVTCPPAAPDVSWVVPVAPPAGGTPGAAAGAGDKLPWQITVASWNLLNFSRTKAYANPTTESERAALLDRIADLVQPYDIVFFQEILQGWNDEFPPPLGARMVANGFVCTVIPPELGWAGRREIYAYCYKPTASGGVILTPLANVAGASRTGLRQPASQTGSYCGAQIWMRPPSVTTFYVQPPQNDPVSFNFFDNHTKPGYNHRYLPGGGKTPLTPSWYPASRPAGFPTPPSGTLNWPTTISSVYFELDAIDINLASLAPPGAFNVILGDLNADCASLPGYQRRDVLTADQGWTWHISEGTNTGRVRASQPAALSRGTCAYDRFILDAGAQGYERGSGVSRDRIADRVNSKQVSDHFLVWLKLGRAGTKRSAGALVAVAEVEAPAVKRARKAVTAPAEVEAEGLGVELWNVAGAPVTAADFYIVSYLEGTLFAGSATFPLVDVRGAPDAVTVDPGGGITVTATGELPSWSVAAGVTGLYRFVLDVDGDAVFDASRGDLVTQANAYDLIVYDDTMLLLDSDVVTAGDNGRTRDLFSTGKAMNIYFMAQNVPSGFDEVDVYVVSRQRLDALYPEAALIDWTWESAKSWSTRIDLPSVSVPVNLEAGPVVIDRLTSAELVNTFEVSADRTVFEIAWKSPATLTSGKAFAEAPPPPPASLPAQSVYEAIAMFGDGCGADPTDIGVSVADFNIVCDAADPFVALYGNYFNVVIDVDRDGFFSGPDQVDTQDVGQIAEWFSTTGQPLGPGNRDPEATAEYQKLLVGRSNMLAIPARYGVWDDTTSGLSSFLFCAAELEQRVFEEVVEPGSQLGFFLYDEDEYEDSRDTGAYVERFVNLMLDSSFHNDAGIYTADEWVIIDDSATLTADVCFSAAQGFEIGNGSHVIAPPPTAAPPVQWNTVVPQDRPPGPVLHIEPSTTLLIEDTALKIGGVLLLALIIL